MTYPSLPPEQRTMLTERGDELANEPIPGMEVCDFCSETPVAWGFPCGLVVLTPGNVTSDPWAACEPCHALILADEREALADRAMRAAAREGAPEFMRPMFVALHRRFFAARQGEPFRV